MHGWLPPEVDLVRDASAADWVLASLRPMVADRWVVASFMPGVFDAYARVFHPAGDRGGERAGLRWSEVASRLGRPFHSEVQFEELVGEHIQDRHPILGDIEPMDGSLPLRLLRSLVGFLGRWTDDDERCWFAMWDGNGTWWKGAHGGDLRWDDERDAVLRDTPRVHTPRRDYFLMRGHLPSVVPLFEAAGSQSPAMWWPERHTWLVSTEVDGFSSYIGGPADLIGELLRSDEIEAAPSRLDAQLDWGL